MFFTLNLNRMMTLIAKVTIAQDSADSKDLRQVADFFLSQCVQGFVPSQCWSEESFYYTPDEESEVSGVEYPGLVLTLRRPCRSCHNAMLVVQIIQSLALLCDRIYDQHFSFELVSCS
jgi:hypothetical protein